MTFASSLQFVRGVEIRPAAVALGVGLAAVLSVNGGYYATSWGWTAAALAWAAVIAAAVCDCPRPSRYELLFSGGFGMLAAWTMLSRAWSIAPGLPLGEAERTLVYVAGALGGAVIVKRGDVRALLGGVTGGITLVSGYALLTRFFPGTLDSGSPVAGIRLSTPVGYWNGLGLISAMGFLLALTFVGMARSPFGRAAAGAALPVLATTLYFTYGRGAWLALFVGLVVLFGLAADRLQLVIRAAPSAILAGLLVWRASTRDALTHADASVQLAIREGHSLAALALGFCLASGYAAFVMRAVPASDELPRDARKIARWAGIAVLGLALVAAGVRFGGPQTIARHAYDSFTGAPVSSANLNSRLLSLSNDNRLGAWRIALHAFEAHPLGGIGAGAFTDYWRQHRTSNLKIEDAHSLYLETAAELGIVGLVLLVGALAMPFAAFRRSRDVSPVCAGAVAALSAYAVHAAADWDWEQSGVTLAAILCGVAVLAANRQERQQLAGRWRMLPLGVGSVVAVLAVLGLVGNLALSAGAAAARRGDLAHAASDARRAHWFAPWSAAPWQKLGEAQLGLGDLPGARRSFHAAIAEDPQDSRIWLELAKASSGSARVAAFAQARRFNPLDSSIAVIERQLSARKDGSNAR
jgi:hypothetical protein